MERFQFSPIYACGDLRPQLAADVLVAPGAVLYGAIQIGAGSSVWFNATIRGDVHWVRIGQMTNVQDGAVLHVTHDTAPLQIGNRVTIGHSAIVHGCTIGDECLVGMGATVLDGAVMQDRSMVAAGAVVSPGTVVPSGVIVAGIPAKPLRKLSDDELADLPLSAQRYYEYSRQLAADLRRGPVAGD